MYVITDNFGEHVVFTCVNEANEYGITPFARLSWKYNNHVINQGDWLECDDGGIAQVIKITKNHLFLPGQQLRITSPIIWSMRREFLGTDMSNNAITVTEHDAKRLAKSLLSKNESEIATAKKELRELALASVIQGLNPDSKYFLPCIVAVRHMLGDDGKSLPDFGNRQLTDQSSNGKNPTGNDTGKTDFSANPYEDNQDG